MMASRVKHKKIADDTKITSRVSSSIDKRELQLNLNRLLKVKLGTYTDAARGLGVHLRDIGLELVAGRNPLPRDTGPE